ncbi:uncharacterized protein LOC111340979 [Stylophora pistillata]|uniref:uncharacterized protein LOC111340979 n=1 Tax=Stylophora pistillata TaxID=50429 RepID=UPI000C04DCA6|nr:uncharacterized protein LOC111340979 [Stylophora pistillata]XP_022803643.1 uncharacterized protein LOC111340979 [Stylophora pistillata]
MKTLFLALIFQCFIIFTLEQNFEILRRSNGRDSIDIPASVCQKRGANPAIRCKTLGAFNLRRKKCSCICPSRNATFMFHQKRWSCFPNKQGRSHYYRGCSFTAAFTRESGDRRIPSIGIGERRYMSLRPVFGFWSLWTCSLNIPMSWFADCWDTRHRLSQYSNIVTKLFTIGQRKPTDPYFLRVNRNVPGTNLFQGKIMNFMVECTLLIGSSPLRTRSCLLFKLEGKTTCPVTKPVLTSSSTMPSLSSSSASFTSLNGLSKTISHGVSSTAIATQSSISVTSLFPKASAKHRIITVSSLKASTLQPTISIIHPKASSSNSHVSAMSPTPSLLQSIASETFAEGSETQTTMSEIAPAPLDTLERSLTEPEIDRPHAQVTIKTTSASVPATQPTVAETLPTEPTARTLGQVDPKTNNTKPTNSSPKAPPSISSDSRQKNKGSKESSSSSSIFIIGIAAALVFAAVIAVIIAYRRHYLKERHRANSEGYVSDGTTEVIVMKQRRPHPSNKDKSNNNTPGFKSQTLRMSTNCVPPWLTDMSQSHVNGSLEEEDRASHLYAPIEIPRIAATSQPEPFYHVLENPGKLLDQVSEINRHGANIHCNKREPFYYVLEGPYLDDTERSAQCGASSSEEPIYCTLDEVYPRRYGSSRDTCENDSIYNVLDRRYFNGSKVPDHYVFVSPRVDILNRLETPDKDVSTAPSNYAPKCDHMERQKVLDKRFFEESEVADHYVQIFPFTLDNMIRRINPTSSRKSSLGRLSTDGYLEECYFQRSNIPSQYVNVALSVQGFSALEEIGSNPNSLRRTAYVHSTPNSLERLDCVLKGPDEPEYSSWRELYLSGNVVLNERGPSALEELNSNPNSLRRGACGHSSSNSLKRLDCALRSPDEPDYCLMMENYLKGNVALSRQGFSALEELSSNPNSLRRNACVHSNGNSLERLGYTVECPNEPDYCPMMENYLKTKVTLSGQGICALEELSWNPNSLSLQRLHSTQGGLGEPEYRFMSERYLRSKVALNGQDSGTLVELSCRPESVHSNPNSLHRFDDALNCPIEPHYSSSMDRYLSDNVVQNVRGPSALEELISSNPNSLRRPDCIHNHSNEKALERSDYVLEFPNKPNCKSSMERYLSDNASLNRRGPSALEELMSSNPNSLGRRDCVHSNRNSLQRSDYVLQFPNEPEYSSWMELKMYLRANIALNEQVSSVLEELHSNPNSLKRSNQHSLMRPDCALECPKEPDYSSWRDSHDPDLSVTRGESGDSTEDMNLNAFKQTDCEERSGANRYRGITLRRGAVIRKNIAKKPSEEPTD